ncbi:MAG: beta-galactosidase trimerization domain-containing protein [Pirellulales bacterium]|nr:beta-galactosidase trimerization domain-containing protein [Pirellulales bacterium]
MTFRGNVCVLFFTVIGLLSHVCRTSADTLWIKADDATTISDRIILGLKAGMVEEGALGDFLISTVCVTPDKQADFAEYEANVPNPGKYYVWARIRCPMRRGGSFGLFPADEKPSADPQRGLGGKNDNADRWHWVRQGGQTIDKKNVEQIGYQLAKGRWRFRVYPRGAYESTYQPNNWIMSRPVFNPRLNLVCLTTDENYTPTDEDAGRALKLEPSRVDPEALRVEPMNLPKVSDEELKRFGKQPIPDWMRCPRFFTKDTWHEEAMLRQPGDIAYLVRQVAANEGNVLRLAVYASGDAFYQSKVTPHAPGLGELDYLREGLDEGGRLGVKIVVYMWPGLLYNNHPLYHEAAVRLPDGEESNLTHRRPGAHVVCFNNPKYQRFIADVLKEIFSDYGPAGLYVDGPTPPMCFCSHCREKYRRMWGEEMPVDKIARWGRPKTWLTGLEPDQHLLPADDADAAKFAKFYTKTLSDFTELVYQSVKRTKPDAAVLFHRWPRSETERYYEGTLTEVYLRDPWCHARWKFGELANHSNAFSVPTLFNIYIHDTNTQAEARTKAVQGLANGCYPNYWSILYMKPVFGTMRRNAECFDFARTAPVKFLAFPRMVSVDSLRQAVAKNAAVKPSRGPFLESYVGMYSGLMRSGVPIVTLHAGDFEKHLDGFRVLCLANEAALSDRQIESIRKFVADGGGLVATYETSLYDEKGKPRDNLGLADVFGVEYVRTLPPAKRRIRPAAEHPRFKGMDLAELPEHDDAHVFARLSGGTSVAELSGPDASEGSAPAIVCRTYGKGRVVYLPGRWDALQCHRLAPAVERLLNGAVDWVSGGEAPARIEAGGPVAATLFEQPERRILHLVNHNGDSTGKDYAVEPLKEVRVSMRIPPDCRVKRVRRLMADAEVPFDVEGNKLHFTVNSLDEYEAVVAEW